MVTEALEIGFRSEVNKDAINRELDQIRKYAESMLFSVITPDLFPELSQVDPDLVTTYRAEALNNRISILHKYLRIGVYAGKEYLEEVLSEMSYYKKEYELLNYSHPDIPDEVSGLIPFYMYNEEREGLNNAIRLGMYEAINSFNYPALEFMSEQDKRDLRCAAISSKIDTLKIIRGTRKENMDQIPGFNTDNDSVIEDVNRRIQILLDLHEQIYFGNENDVTNLT